MNWLSMLLGAFFTLGGLFLLFVGVAIIGAELGWW